MTKKNPRLLDCRKTGSRMSSLSYRPRDDGQTLSVSAHEGAKPEVGDYLAIVGDDGLMRLYRATSVDHCYNVDPMNMWMATCEFVPGRIARTLKDLPTEFS